MSNRPTAVGTMRRLQGLAVMGHPLSRIADQLGVPNTLVYEAAHGQMATVAAWFAVRVRALTHQLADIVGPCPYTREQARHHGWYSIMVWEDIDDPGCEPCADCDWPEPIVDEVAVRQAADGRRLPLRPPEKSAAVAVMSRRGATVTHISDTLGLRRSAVRELLGAGGV